MKDISIMDVFKSFTYLCKNFDNIYLRNILAILFFNITIQTPIAEFHYKTDRLVYFDEMLYLYNIWMIEHSKIIDFPIDYF